MATSFSRTHRSSHACARPPAEAAAAWIDADRQLRCRPEVASHSRPAPDQLRLRLAEMKHGPTAFTGDYTLVFALDTTGAEPVARWHSLPGGNPMVRGEARFRPRGAGSTVHFEETVTVEMPVGGIAGTLLRPIVEPMMERGMAGFAERMAALP